MCNRTRKQISIILQIRTPGKREKNREKSVDIFYLNKTTLMLNHHINKGYKEMEKML